MSHTRCGAAAMTNVVHNDPSCEDKARGLRVGVVPGLSHTHTKGFVPHGQ